MGDDTDLELFADHTTDSDPINQMSTALALRDEAVELETLRRAIADLEIYCYETWEFDGNLTKDAARRLVIIADNFDWDMPWVEEMRKWSR